MLLPTLPLALLPTHPKAFPHSQEGAGSLVTEGSMELRDPLLAPAGDRTQ